MCKVLVVGITVAELKKQSIVSVNNDRSSNYTQKSQQRTTVSDIHSSLQSNILLVYLFLQYLQHRNCAYGFQHFSITIVILFKLLFAIFSFTHAL